MHRIFVVLASSIGCGLMGLGTARKNEQADDGAEKGERIHSINYARTGIWPYSMNWESGVSGSRSWSSLIHLRASSS